MFGFGMVRSAAVVRLRSAAVVRSSWESIRFCTAASPFPWIAVIPSEWKKKKKKEEDKLTFMSHGRKERIYKLPLPSSSSCGNNNNISLKESFVRSNKDGWMMFVCRDSFVPIIVNPLTGAQLERLPSLYNFLNHQYPQWKRLDYDFFLTDNRVVAFVRCCVDVEYHILVAAMPGDDEWCFIPLPSSSSFSDPIKSIVFHEADNKFYYMDSNNQMQSFRLTRRRCSGGGEKKKTVFENVSPILADDAGPRGDAMLFDSHLVSDGSILLRVRKCLESNKFDISEYSSYEDMWMDEVTNIDLGNKSIFFDRYGARLLTLEGGGDEYLQRFDMERPRRNCIYYTDHDVYFQDNDGEILYHARWVGVYDVDKGTVELCFPTVELCFPTTHPPSDYHLLPSLMWFIPSFSNGQQLAS